jgi:hypothetical protein
MALPSLLGAEKADGWRRRARGWRGDDLAQPLELGGFRTRWRGWRGLPFKKTGVERKSASAPRSDVLSCRWKNRASPASASGTLGFLRFSAGGGGRGRARAEKKRGSLVPASAGGPRCVAGRSLAGG